MTIEELMAALQAIIDGAGVTEAGEPDLTDEEIERYEELEGELQTAQAGGQVLQRHAAYSAVVTPAGVHVGGADADDGDEVLERAFDHYLRTGTENQDIQELRAQGEGAGSEGGFTVPDSFRAKIVDRMVAFGGIGAVGEQVTTGDGRPMPWTTIDDTGNEGEIVDEGGTFSGGADLVFGTATLGAYRYMTGGKNGLPLRVSLEVLQDSVFDIESLVSRKLGMRLARIQATHLVTGDGVKKPQGIIDGLTGIEIAADTAGVTYADLVGFEHSVDPAYRAGSRWAMNDTSLKTVKLIQDAAGDPIFRNDQATMSTPSGEPTLLGYPITIDQAFPDLDVDNNSQNWGVFGDLQEGFAIRRVRDVTIVANPWSRSDYGQVEYTASARMDSVQQNTNSYIALTGEQ